jgi:drug/metabolite transporter (DMT)-like permease
MPAGALGITYVVLSALCFSAKAIFAKLAYKHGVDASTLLALRMLTALPFFALAAAHAEMGAQTALSWGDKARIAVLGSGGYYLAACLDFLGLHYITASLERLILFLYPTLVVGFRYALYGERPPLGIGIAIALSYGGVVVSASRAALWSGSQHAGLGVLLVFGSAVAYAYYLAGTQPLIAKHGSNRITAHALLVASLCVLAEFSWRHGLGGLAQSHDVLLLGACTGIVATVVPAFALTAGIARIGASRASVLGSIGPVSTLVLAWWWLDETIGARDVVGCALVLFGVAYMGRQTRRATAA